MCELSAGRPPNVLASSHNQCDPSKQITLHLTGTGEPKNSLPKDIWGDDECRLTIYLGLSPVHGRNSSDQKC